MSSSLTGISTKYYFIVKQLKVLIRLDFYWLVLIGVGGKKNHTFVFLKKKVIIKITKTLLYIVPQETFLIIF